MKILFVFTGGTIGSTLDKGSNVLSVDAQKSYKIIDAYKKRYQIDFDYDVVEPLSVLSENSTGDTIRKVCSCVQENITKGYDGIIVTHGTDTLQYTASALGYTVGINSVPVCLVSSNKPIESKESNALDNLHGAITFIKNSLGKGAFVIYRNSSEKEVKVHRSTRLLAGKAYSDEVSSVYGYEYGYFDDKFNYVQNDDFMEFDDEIKPLCADSLTESADEILVLNPYPGMVYPEIGDNVKYILLNTYHSGTINTKSEKARAFFEKASIKGVKVYATGISRGSRYESAVLFEELNIIPLKEIAPISAYVKLWFIACSLKGAEDLIHKPLSGDIVVR